MMHNTGITSGPAATAAGALSASGPQPVWMTLDEARDRGFTGEIVFEVDPEVLAYLDNGVVYYAERTADGPLSRRLVEAGVVDSEQLERGTVCVGDIEHLGRLFERDPSVDRDAVLVMTEASTESLIAEMANDAVATVRVTAYRHHPSGVHRWFVGPTDVSPTRPVTAIGQLDGSVIDDLPGAAVGGPDGFAIEWDDLHSVEGVTTSLSVFDDEITLFDPFRDDEVDVEVNGGNLEMPELSLEMATFADGDDDEFEITWPDGVTRSVTSYLEAESPDPSDTSLLDDELHLDHSPAFTETDAGDLHFDMPALELFDDQSADQVPDDVAEAVRRAIAAIESATIDSGRIDLDDLDDLVDIGDLVDIDIDRSGLNGGAAGLDEASADQPPVPAGDLETNAPVAGFGGFAPPTMETRAEVMYAQISGEPITATVDGSMAEPMLPTPELASAALVDGEPGGSNERTSALHRLVGSLRRKDQ